MQSVVFLSHNLALRTVFACVMSWSAVSYPPGGACGVWSGGHLFSVSEMLLWWRHIIIMLLVEGGGRVTSAGDIPDHQDVEMIKDKWKAYRNIIK